MKFELPEEEAPKAAQNEPKEILKKQIHHLEKRMQAHVKNLAFEEAAVVRDELFALKEQLFR